MALSVDDIDVDWDEMGDDAADLMKKYYSQLVELGYGDAADLVGDSRDGASLVFDQSNPAVKKTIDKLAGRIKDVSDTTKDNIRTLVDKAAEEGWSMPELAKQIRAAGEDFSASRAATISRTESGTAYNLGGIIAYRDGGVKNVEVLDGDDDEECADANGSIWTLDEAEENPLAHPNCTRAFSPVVE